MRESSNLREDCGFEKEHRLLEEIREQGRLYLQGSLECAGFCTRMVHQLEEYNNYILFQNKIADERIKGIEQGMLRISERIHELYGVGFPNSFILMLARWVYFGNVFDDALPEDSAEMQQLVADLTEAVRRDAPYSFAVARDLLLMGQSGLGKTYLMHAIAKRLLERGFNVMMISAYRFLDVARRAYFSGKQEEMDTLMDTDVLMIDDMGVEPLMENITIVQWFNLINERQLRGKGTVISTNLNVEELRRRYTERITSRLLDGKQCMLLQFLGDDVRRNKA